MSHEKETSTSWLFIISVYIYIYILNIFKKSFLAHPCSMETKGYIQINCWPLVINFLNKFYKHKYMSPWTNCVENEYSSTWLYHSSDNLHPCNSDTHNSGWVAGDREGLRGTLKIPKLPQGPGWKTCSCHMSTKFRLTFLQLQEVILH